MKDTIYNADIFLRLSKEDDDKEESNSISNQRALILDFLKSQPDIQLHKIRIGDGYSGVDFMRPAFTEMIDDIQAGKVNCVIVKDMSRILRDYLQTGFYTEVFFRQHVIRFIAISNGIDSKNGESSEFAAFLILWQNGTRGT